MENTMTMNDLGVPLMAEIRRSPVTVGSLSHHSQGFQKHPNGGCLGFLPSTVPPGKDRWVLHLYGERGPPLAGCQFYEL